MQDQTPPVPTHIKDAIRDAIKDEFRAMGRVVRDALLMIVRHIEARYLK